jgi:hypothetical protein
VKAPIVLDITRVDGEVVISLTGADEELRVTGAGAAREMLESVSGRPLWAAHAAQLQLDFPDVLENLGWPELQCAVTLSRALEPIKAKPIAETAPEVVAMLAALRTRHWGTRAWDAAMEVVKEGKIWRTAGINGNKVDVFELGMLMNAEFRIIQDANRRLGFNMLSPEHVKGTWLRSIGAFVEDTGKYDWAHPSHVGTEGVTSENRELFAIYKGSYSAASRYSILRGIKRRLVRDRVYPLTMMNQAATGRMAIREPGLQSLPGDIRHIIRPRLRGTVFVSVDHSAAEMKILARMIQLRFDDNTLADAVMSNDPYQMLADAAGLQRKEVKLHLLAHLYGQNPRTLESIMGKRPARALLGSLSELFPQIPGFRRDSEARARAAEPLTTMFGRPLPKLAGTTYEDRPQLATNYLIQGSARDAYGQGVLRAVEEFGAEAFAIPLHDELIIELPRSEARNGGPERLLKAMRIDLGGGVILTGKAKVFTDGWGRP